MMACGYDEFGGPVAVAGGLDQPFRFSTKPYDPQTGLAYFGYRFYSPAMGRWLNRDPIGEAGGLNLYAFSGNNPVNFNDPMGLITVEEFLFRTARVGGLSIIGYTGLIWYQLNYGSPYGYTLLIGTPFTFYGRNYDRQTEAKQSVIRAHEAAHQRGCGEVLAYRATINEIDILLSRGWYGGFLSEGGRPLTADEYIQLKEFRVMALRSLAYYSMPLHRRMAWQYEKFKNNYIY